MISPLVAAAQVDVVLPPSSIRIAPSVQAMLFLAGSEQPDERPALPWLGDRIPRHTRAEIEAVQQMVVDGWRFSREAEAVEITRISDWHVRADQTIWIRATPPSVVVTTLG